MTDSSLLKIKKIIIYAFLFFLVALSILPFWIMFANATRSTYAIQSSVSLFPGKYLVYNWQVLTGRGFSIFKGFANSSVIAFSSTALTLYFSALTAYGIVIYKFKGRNIFFVFIMIIMMIPPQLGLVGFYRFMLKIELVDSFLPLILPAIASPATVFFLRQYLVASFPNELVEAARIDGSKELFTFHKIALPIMKPAIATMGIFSVVTSWNNYMTPLVLLTSESKFTLPMLVRLLLTDIYSTEYGGVYLGLSLSVLPLLVTYFALSKYIIKGVAIGSVKG